MEQAIEIAKQIEAKQAEINDLRSTLEDLLLAAGLGAMAQDPVTLVVYKVIKPKGTFMYYRDVDYARTAIGEERAGTLSKKDAEAAGFKLKS